MDRKFLAIRYVKVKTTEDGLLGPKGTMARGQEFHQSRIIADAFKGQRPYQITTSTGQTFKEGWASANALGSYIHLHFKSNPSIPSAFVQKCASYKKITS
jgi:cobyrinic acid a,c-diamide synthase